jgi:competence protein ComGC
VVYLVSPTSRQLKISTNEHPRGAGFTLIDILVTITVISILIGIMLPSIAMVRESARKVICSSDMRQIGLGMNLYAEDNKDMLPSSVFLNDDGGRTASPLEPHLMDTIRTDQDQFADRVWGQWDGIGLLFFKGYINAPSVYYCPSHKGTNTIEAYEDQWNFETTDQIIANYQFRGIGPEGQRLLYNIKSSDALVTDSLRSLDDVNHERGLNVLAAGLSVNWFDDVDGLVLQTVLSRTDDSVVDDVNQAWQLFDGGTNPTD